jgi:tRNA (cmo5U34)-methyltransferase
MNEFDLKAAEWDNNPTHWDRSEAIVNEIRNLIPLNKEMTALEYGAGTGIASFMLKDHLKEITLMDNSSEMVKVINEKITTTKVKNLKTLNFDLEHTDYKGGKFDLIFTQMVLHHVVDIKSILCKFSQLLNSGGYLAIADLYEEDGSFHGDGSNRNILPVFLKKTIFQISPTRVVLSLTAKYLKPKQRSSEYFC